MLFGAVASILLFALANVTIVLVWGQWIRAHPMVFYIVLLFGTSSYFTGLLFGSRSLVQKHRMICPSCGIWLAFQSSIEETGKCTKCNSEVFASDDLVDARLERDAFIPREQLPGSSMSSKEEITPFMRFFIRRLVPWGFILLGAWMLFTGAGSLLRAKESMAWPVAEGRILTSSVAYRSDRDGSRIPYVNIEYMYTVDGKTHVGDRIFFIERDFSTLPDMEGKVNQYPKDKAVHVRYLPTDPDVCVLEPGIHKEAFLYPAAGLFFIFAAIVLPILLPRAMNTFRKSRA
jgi:hypothetical protein